MNFNIKKRTEDDYSVDFEVVIPPEELLKHRYYYYFRNRSQFTRDLGSRIDYSSFLKLFPSKANRLDFLAYTDSLEKIREAIIEQGLIEDEEELEIWPYYIEDIPIDENGNKTAIVRFLKIDKIDFEDFLECVPKFPIFSSDTFDEHVDKALLLELEHLREQNARLIPTEDAIDDSKTASLRLILSTENGETEDITDSIFSSNEEILDYFFSVLQGRKAGESIPVEPKALPSIPDKMLSIRIDQVYDKEYSDLDDDFAAEVSEYDTFEELKSSLKEDLRLQILERIESELLEVTIKSFLNTLYEREELPPTWEDLLDYKTRDYYLANKNLEIDYTRDPASFSLGKLGDMFVKNLSYLLGKKFQELYSEYLSEREKTVKLEDLERAGRIEISRLNSEETANKLTDREKEEMRILLSRIVGKCFRDEIKLNLNNHDDEVEIIEEIKETE